jgi:hypothetical protein
VNDNRPNTHEQHTGHKMTIQTTTTVFYKDKYFELIDSRNVTLFDPKILGIECYAASTANWNGYKCEYSIEGGELYLIGFSMNGTKANRDLALLNFLMVENPDYDARCEIKMVDEAKICLDIFVRSDQFYGRSENFKIQNSFLIARDRREKRQLSASRGDLPWYYKEIYLVRIKNNRLFSVENYSNEFYQFLRLFTIDGVLEEKYRAVASEFLTENLGVKFDSYFKIIE